LLVLRNTLKKVEKGISGHKTSVPFGYHDAFGQSFGKL